jgi:hypothetical protein
MNTTRGDVECEKHEGGVDEEPLVGVDDVPCKDPQDDTTICLVFIAYEWELSRRRGSCSLSNRTTTKPSGSP